MKLTLFGLCVLLVAANYATASPFDIGGWFKNATQAAGDWINGAAKDTKDWFEKAAKDTKNWVEGAAKDTENWFKQAGKDTEQWFKQAGKDTENWFKGAARDTAAWVTTAAKDVENEFNKFGKSITDFFDSIGQECKKAFIVMKFRWMIFEKEANEFFRTCGEKVKQAIEDIKKRVDETGESIVQIAFQWIYDTLQNARDKLEDLSKTADAKFENIMKDVQQTLFNEASQIESFMERMKVVVLSKNDQKRGMLILESYAKESHAKIFSCSEAAVQPVRELYEATKSLINKTIDKLEEFIHDIEDCFNKGLSPEVAKCGKNLGKIAKSALKEVGAELLGMKATLITTAVKEVVNLVCIGQTRIDVELSKGQVESAINGLE